VSIGTVAQKTDSRERTMDIEARAAAQAYHLDVR
jgi:hypothetical protein